MKRKLFSVLLSAAMLTTALAGCGSSGNQASGGGTASAENSVIDVGAGEDAVELDYWTFVELHGQHFETMLKKWNEDNPDRQI